MTACVRDVKAICVGMLMPTGSVLSMVFILVKLAADVGQHSVCICRRRRGIECPGGTRGA